MRLAAHRVYARPIPFDRLDNLQPEFRGVSEQSILDVAL